MAFEGRNPAPTDGKGGFKPFPSLPGNEAKPGLFAPYAASGATAQNPQFRFPSKGGPAVQQGFAGAEQPRPMPPEAAHPRAPTSLFPVHAQASAGAPRVPGFASQFSQQSPDPKLSQSPNTETDDKTVVQDPETPIMFGVTANPTSGVNVPSKFGSNPPFRVTEANRPGPAVTTNPALVTAVPQVPAPTNLPAVSGLGPQTGFAPPASAPKFGPSTFKPLNAPKFSVPKSISPTADDTQPMDPMKVGILPVPSASPPNFGSVPSPPQSTKESLQPPKFGPSENTGQSPPGKFNPPQSANPPPKFGPLPFPGAPAPRLNDPQPKPLTSMKPGFFNTKFGPVPSAATKPDQMKPFPAPETPSKPSEAQAEEQKLDLKSPHSGSPSGVPSAFTPSQFAAGPRQSEQSGGFGAPGKSNLQTFSKFGTPAGEIAKPSVAFPKPAAASGDLQSVAFAPTGGFPPNPDAKKLGVNLFPKFGPVLPSAETRTNSSVPLESTEHSSSAQEPAVPPVAQKAGFEFAQKPAFPISTGKLAIHTGPKEAPPQTDFTPPTSPSKFDPLQGGNQPLKPGPPKLGPPKFGPPKFGPASIPKETTPPEQPVSPPVTGTSPKPPAAQANTQNPENRSLQPGSEAAGSSAQVLGTTQSPATSPVPPFFAAKQSPFLGNPTSSAANQSPTKRFEPPTTQPPAGYKAAEAAVPNLLSPQFFVPLSQDQPKVVKPPPYSVNPLSTVTQQFGMKPVKVTADLPEYTPPPPQQGLETPPSTGSQLPPFLQPVGNPAPADMPKFTPPQPQKGPQTPSSTGPQFPPFAQPVGNPAPADMPKFTPPQPQKGPQIPPSTGPQFPPFAQPVGNPAPADMPKFTPPQPQKGPQIPPSTGPQFPPFTQPAGNSAPADMPKFTPPQPQKGPQIPPSTGPQFPPFAQPVGNPAPADMPKFTPPQPQKGPQTPPSTGPQFPPFAQPIGNPAPADMPKFTPPPPKQGPQIPSSTGPQFPPFTQPSGNPAPADKPKFTASPSQQGPQIPPSTGPQSPPFLQRSGNPAPAELPKFTVPPVHQSQQSPILSPPEKPIVAFPPKSGAEPLKTTSGLPKFSTPPNPGIALPQFQGPKNPESSSGVPNPQQFSQSGMKIGFNQFTPIPAAGASEVQSPGTGQTREEAKSELLSSQLPTGGFAGEKKSALNTSAHVFGTSSVIKSQKDGPPPFAMNPTPVPPQQVAPANPTPTVPLKPAFHFNPAPTVFQTPLHPAAPANPAVPQGPAVFPESVTPPSSTPAVPQNPPFFKFPSHLSAAPQNPAAFPKQAAPPSFITSAVSPNLTPAVSPNPTPAVPLNPTPAVPPSLTPAVPSNLPEPGRPDQSLLPMFAPKAGPTGPQNCSSPPPVQARSPPVAVLKPAIQQPALPGQFGFFPPMTGQKAGPIVGLVVKPGPSKPGQSPAPLPSGPPKVAPVSLPAKKMNCASCKALKSESQFYAEIKCKEHDGFNVCYRCIEANQMKFCPACNREYSKNEMEYMPIYIDSARPLE